RVFGSTGKSRSGSRCSLGTESLRFFVEEITPKSLRALTRRVESANLAPSRTREIPGQLSRPAGGRVRSVRPVPSGTQEPRSRLRRGRDRTPGGPGQRYSGC